MIHILIVSWAVAAGSLEEHSSSSIYRRWAIAMQEFNSADACQRASVEAGRIAPGLRAVCVPKGKL